MKQIEMETISKETITKNKFHYILLINNQF